MRQDKANDIYKHLEDQILLIKRQYQKAKEEIFERWKQETQK